ncbi:hypothetical protein IV38_GL001041 [Lactobacillus selangorensis]|uniref:HTH tetR-type domain-containing protein n=1 Tax=Lactobacillus selangorensis TaxID=81857 RepID=A0A0R2G7Y2_9LACO|nr:TetR/AcrR family transcriptional regulator [Lactobacillus selangorensis]KRN28834.1 hypothetical protein IV38_GL001041 [Lactobacillus selangorensis]KRN32756.1 hypothetical protein IV40_GL000812 [Lactobacillus selangorensis]
MMKKKNPEKYQQIIDATVQLIDRQDVAMVSTTQVAKKVGISQSNIYIYFKNRDDLIKHVFIREVDAMSQFVHDTQVPATDLFGQFASQLDALFQFALQHPTSLNVIQKILRSYSYQHLVAKPDDLNAANAELLVTLKKGQQTGLFKQVDLSLLQNTILSNIKLQADNIHHGKYTAAEQPFERVRQLIFDAILNGSRS